MSGNVVYHGRVAASATTRRLRRGGRIPVLGHAFVGLATAMVTRPRPTGRSEPVSRAIVPELWGFIAVVLAYAPDICSQALRAVGSSEAPRICHSLLFAVAFPAMFAFAMRAVGAPFRRVLFLALFSILAHDALDIAQATDKAPFWPFSDRTIALPGADIPSGLFGETLIFGGLFLLFLLGRMSLRRSAGSARPAQAEPCRPSRRLAALNTALVASIVLLAAATLSLRDVRERQLESSRALIESGRYADGLKVLEASELWPSPAKPGRTDYLRGIALLGLGDRDRAESYLLKAYRADPAYLWVVIDLAMFYAESPLPLAARRDLAAPYLEALRRDFAGRKPAADAARRIDALLSGADRSR